MGTQFLDLGARVHILDAQIHDLGIQIHDLGAQHPMRENKSTKLNNLDWSSILKSRAHQIPERWGSTIDYFEGVCLTPVILATMRGEGRLRAVGRYIVLPGLPGSVGSTGSADEFQIAHFIYDFTANNYRASLRCNVFCYFFIPLSSKTPIFYGFFGRRPARNALKTRCFS